MLFGTWSQAHAYDSSDYMETRLYLSIFKSCTSAESIRGGRTMPYAVRESWLSVNTGPFRIVSKWTSTIIHTYVCSSASYAHVSHTYAGPHS